MNVRFIQVWFRNFMSYGNNVTAVTFDKVGTTLITGEDLDNTHNGKSANGTGKTSIINALVYALYDKPLSKISVDKLINNVNRKQMQVCVEFVGSCGSTYRVLRERKMKAGASGNNVFLYKDGVDISVDANGTNRLIEQAIGIPYQVFVRIVVFSAGLAPFLDLPHKSLTAPNQTDFIEELFGLTALTAKADKLKEVIKSSKSTLEIKQASIQMLEKEHERHRALIASTKSRIAQWEASNKSTIEDIQSELSLATSIDVAKEQLIHTELMEAKRQSSELANSIASISRDISTLTGENRKLQHEHDHLLEDACPYCKQGMPNANEKATAVHQAIEEVSSKLSAAQERKQLRELEMVRLTQLIAELQGKRTCANIQEIVNIHNSRASLEAKLESLRSATNPHIAVLDELIEVELDPIDYSDVEREKKVLDHQQFLLKLLTKSDSFVRKRLLSKNLPFLNEKLQAHLLDLGLPHKVMFDPDLSASISRFGQPLDFGSLSAGQQARVNFALSLAFKQVKQRLYAKINISMYDEVLDRGLDATGIQLAAKLIKRISKEERSVSFIISHRDEVVGMFDSTMRVVMSKGFSSIDGTQPIEGT